MTLEEEYKERWRARPTDVDCWECAGIDGVSLTSWKMSNCCAGTGLDTIPWAELFKRMR